MPGLMAMSLLSGSAAHGAGAIPDLSGTYWAATYSAKIPVLGGGEPPLNDEGKAAYRKNQSGLKDGSIEDPVRKWGARRPRYRVDNRPLNEEDTICSAGNDDKFNLGFDPVPHADTPDF